MRPILFEAGNFELQSYVLLLSMGTLLGTAVTVWLNLHVHKPYPVTPIWGLGIMIPALVGARIFYCVRVGLPLHVWTDFNTGGLMFGGGFVFGLLVLLVLAKINGIPALSALDLVAPGVALGEAIVRIGCFLNGCCWGRPTYLPWAVRFPRFSLVFDGQASLGLITRNMETLPVHPVQIYSTVILFLLFLILCRLFFSNEKTGFVFGWYCIAYGGIRFLLRFVRADVTSDYTSMIFWNSQLAAAAMVIAGMVVLRVRRRYGERLHARLF